MTSSTLLSKRRFRFKNRAVGIIALGLGSIVSPVMAQVESSSMVLAQVVDTEGVQSKSVREIWKTFQSMEPYTLSVSILLVIMLLFAGGLLKPGGFAKAGLRDLSKLPAVMFVFACFVVLLAQSSGPTLVSKIEWIQQQEFTVEQVGIINSLVSYALAVVAGLGMLFVLKRSSSSGESEDKSGLGISLLDLPVGLGCFLLAYPFLRLMQIAGQFAYTQTQNESPDGIAHETLRRLVEDPNNPWIMALIGGAVIGAPIVEELIFRVFLQGALIKWLKTPWLSIVVTSILFAAIHRLNSVPVPWHALPVLFAVGLTCGVAYERTRRVGVPITMHICFNLFNVMVALIVGADAAQTGV